MGFRAKTISCRTSFVYLRSKLLKWSAYAAGRLAAQFEWFFLFAVISCHIPWRTCHLSSWHLPNTCWKRQTLHDCHSASNIQHAMAKTYGSQVSVNHSHGHHQFVIITISNDFNIMPWPHQCNSPTIGQHYITPCVVRVCGCFVRSAWLFEWTN